MHQFKVHLGMYLSIATQGGPPTHKEDQISGWCTRNMSVIKPKWNALACWEHTSSSPRPSSSWWWPWWWWWTSPPWKSLLLIQNEMHQPAGIEHTLEWVVLSYSSIDCSSSRKQTSSFLYLVFLYFYNCVFLCVSVCFSLFLCACVCCVCLLLNVDFVWAVLEQWCSVITESLRCRCVCCPLVCVCVCVILHVSACVCWKFRFWCRCHRVVILYVCVCLLANLDSDSGAGVLLPPPSI